SAARGGGAARRRRARALGTRARSAARRRAGGIAAMLTLPRFEWTAPSSLDEALGLLSATAGETLLVAGGTDAVPNLQHRRRQPRRVVRFGRVAELRGMRRSADGLELGALVTLAAIAADETIRRDHPSLAKAASLVAGPQLRNMGTIGGNLCLDTRCT